MAIGIALSGVAVSVGAWAVGAALVPDGGAVPPALVAGMEGENDASSWWKTTLHRARAALVATALF